MVYNITMADKITWANEKRKLSELVPWERNPRQISEKQAERLVDSFEQFGQVEIIAIGPENQIYNGHQRLKVLSQKYGSNYEVDVRVASRALTEKEREKLTVFLHKGAAGEWDFDVLANEFELDDLLDWGFDKKDLDLDLWAGEPPDDVEPQIDKAEELREKWGVESGQLWKLGEHRLICGDCTDKAVVERVMSNDRARLVWTDPPYGVKLGVNIPEDNPMHYKVRTIKNDDLNDTELLKLINNSLTISAEYTTAGAAIYMAAPSGNKLPVLINSFDGSGFVYHWCLVWVKDHLVMGRGDYHMRHENILYGWKEDAAHYFIDSRKKDSVFEYKRPITSPEHPTMKPVELVEDMINNSSELGDIVYDPFLGSGTTLIACERLGRKCRAVEISPAYVAVAIQRWVDVTGGTPELVN